MVDLEKGLPSMEEMEDLRFNGLEKKGAEKGKGEGKGKEKGKRGRKGKRAEGKR